MRYLLAELLRWVADQISPSLRIPYGDLEFAKARYIAVLNAQACAQRDLMEATRRRVDDMET